MEGVKTYLDMDEVRSQTTDIPYPHIKIVDFNKYVTIVVKSALEDGTLPLLGTYKGVTKIVKKMSLSALNIDKLLRVTELEAVTGPGESVVIHDVLDYMEVVDKWI